MGLTISHNTFSAPYSTFMEWRRWVALQIGIPIDLMEGFYQDGELSMFTLLDHKFPQDAIEMREMRRFQKMLPLKWSAFKPSPLHELLFHSDCEGYINYSSAKKIAKSLKSILDNATEKDEWMEELTQQFIYGCNRAVQEKQKLQFR